MKNKYYDRWFFLKTNDYSKINPIEANSKFEEYLEKYPFDYSARGYYIYNLITLGQFDQAEKTLEELEKTIKQDPKFSRQEYKLQSISHDILLDKFKLLCYKEKYIEAYELMKNNKQAFEHMNMNDVIFYLKKKLGRLQNDKRQHNGYLFRQIVKYDENDFFDHIKKHMADYNCELDEPNKNIFVPDFPIKEVVEEIKKHIPSDKGLCFGFMEDVYVFKYDECGRHNNRMVNYFKVICFHGTKDFITMCPVSGCENWPYIDLNYMVSKNYETKFKRISKVDKFNQKYRRK